MASPEDKYVNNFFKFGEPCNFPGCDDLRKQYLLEMEAGKSKTGCHACYRMGLARKFKTIIVNRLTRGN
tara:strand:- start:164 stop:370 length:207 start_codon:yes stop_codon:yes gene_type:complete